MTAEEASSSSTLGFISVTASLHGVASPRCFNVYIYIYTYTLEFSQVHSAPARIRTQQPAWLEELEDVTVFLELSHRVSSCLIALWLLGLSP